MNSAIFLDRDGVIIENRPEYVRDWSHVTFIPQALEGLRALRDQEWKIVLITNQSAVGRGYVSRQKADEINERLVEAINHQGGRIDGVYMCVHAPSEDCSCRKPRPGLIQTAANDFSLNLAESWLVGDAWSDLQAGYHAGIPNLVMVKTGRGQDQLDLTNPPAVGRFWIVEHFLDFVSLIQSSKAPG
jgi:D-glycero-D-manno-heptose 1,7-bisphosphate phosphatase